jgi:hypothetical protein
VSIYRRSFISRILSPTGGISHGSTVIHLTKPVAPSLAFPPDATNTRRHSPVPQPCSYRTAEPGRQPVSPVCLAPRRVCRAPFLAVRAVGFYPAFSPVPCGLAATRWFVFCDTFRRSKLTPTTPRFNTRCVALRCSDFPLRNTVTHFQATVPRPHISPTPTFWNKQPLFDQSGLLVVLVKSKEPGEMDLPGSLC